MKWKLYETALGKYIDKLTAVILCIKLIIEHSTTCEPRINQNYIEIFICTKSTLALETSNSQWAKMCALLNKQKIAQHLWITLRNHTECLHWWFGSKLALSRDIIVLENDLPVHVYGDSTTLWSSRAYAGILPLIVMMHLLVIYARWMNGLLSTYKKIDQDIISLILLEKWHLLFTIMMDNFSSRLSSSGYSSIICFVWLDHTPLCHNLVICASLLFQNVGLLVCSDDTGWIITTQKVIIHKVTTILAISRMSDFQIITTC